MKYFLILMTIFAYFGCSMPIKSKAQLDECSRLAENVPMPDYNFTGVEFENLNAEKAIAACSKTFNADPSDPHTQFLLARALTKKKEYKKAFNLLEQSCDAGDDAGCTLIGGYYSLGFPPVNLDRDKALSIFEKACAHKNPVACLNAAEAYVFNVDRIKDKVRGEKLMYETCQNKYYPACQRYSEAVVLEKIPLDEKKYQFAASQACESGMDCFLFWEIFEKRKDVQSNKIQFEVTKKSCENGFMKACDKTGYFYFVGLGVDKDIEKSLKMKEKACEGGILSSCDHAGQLLLNLNRETDRAIGLIDGACRSGDERACYHLGRIYYSRPKLAKTDDAAKEIFAFACKKYKHGMSCDALKALEEKK